MFTVNSKPLQESQQPFVKTEPLPQLEIRGYMVMTFTCSWDRLWTQQLNWRFSSWGLTKLESTVRYLGIEVEAVLELSEQTEI